MLVSMPVRCDQCGHESDPRYRFCGMCGAKLPPPPPPPPEPVAAKPREEPMRQVSGPSFLGLAEEPSSSVTYLLEDEESERHWGRALVLLVILVAVGVAGWHWRSNVRAYVVWRLAQHSNNNALPEQAGNPGGAASTSASETAPQNPSGITPVQKQDSAQPPTPATPAAPAQQPVTTTSNAVPNGEQANPPAASPQTSQTSSAPVPDQAGQSSSAASGSPQPQAGSAPAAQESSGSDLATEENTKPSAATKRARSKANEAAINGAGADQLEAEGERYLYGTGVSPNCSRAEKDLQAAAEQGSSKADSVLGTMYATGHCVNRDLPLAYRWFAMALQRDPGNTRLQGDLQVLWNQMTSDERQVAMRRQ